MSWPENLMPTRCVIHIAVVSNSGVATISHPASRSANCCLRPAAHLVGGRRRSIAVAVPNLEQPVFRNSVRRARVLQSTDAQARRIQVDELIKQLQEKTGLPVDKVQDIIETVIGFISDKLPRPIADQVQGFLGGDDDGGSDDGGGGLLDQAKDALGGLGGLLGGKD